jgi:hypothetical protein
MVLLMALGTSKRKKREYSSSGWWWRIEMCCTYIQRLIDLTSGRLGFVLTSQWTTRAPFDWRRRRRRHGSHLGFVFAAMRAATPMLLHHDASIQIDNSGIGHGDLLMAHQTSTWKP